MECFLLKNKDLFESIAYLVAIFGIVIFYINWRKDKSTNEYLTYDSVDNKFIDFLKLGIENENIRVLPEKIYTKFGFIIKEAYNKNIVIVAEKATMKKTGDATETQLGDIEIKTKVSEIEEPKIKQIVAFEILTSIFERAYVLYFDKSKKIRNKQWTGWEDYIKIWLDDEEYRDSWSKMGDTWEKDFENYMKSILPTGTTGVSSEQESKSLKISLRFKTISEGYIHYGLNFFKRKI